MSDLVRNLEDRFSHVVDHFIFISTFQEEEFLRKGIAKIAALKPKPDILIVEKSVSRLAQDFLLQNGITLVYNVKMVCRNFMNFSMLTFVDTSDSKHFFKL